MYGAMRPIEINEVIEIIAELFELDCGDVQVFQ